MTTTEKKLRVGQRVFYAGQINAVAGRIRENLGGGLYLFRPETHTEGGWAVRESDLTPEVN